VIVDAHGHYTTAPRAHENYRLRLREASDAAAPLPPTPAISDDELRESVEGNQLRILRERGEDAMLLAPKASAMAHDMPDPDVAGRWARACNDLVHRVCALYPDTLAPVAQLPQTPRGNIEAVVAELRRTVEELGFVGCLLSPDPSGTWAGAPLTDESWFPVYEALEDLGVPAMIHVSSACNPNFDTLGAHYLNADTSVFMQLLSGDLFARYPRLRLVIPHGGGAVPYHWGRYRGLACRNGWADPSALLENVSFDTCVYHQAGVDLLTCVIPAPSLLFASEMLGAVRGADPDTGVAWDDTLRYLERAPLSDDDRTQIVSRNAFTLYPRLASALRVEPPI
jgi:4-oxalmesaconate hydratase